VVTVSVSAVPGSKRSTWRSRNNPSGSVSVVSSPVACTRRLTILVCASFEVTCTLEVPTRRQSSSSCWLESAVATAPLLPAPRPSCPVLSRPMLSPRAGCGTRTNRSRRTQWSSSGLWTITTESGGVVSEVATRVAMSNLPVSTLVTVTSARRKSPDESGSEKAKS